MLRRAGTTAPTAQVLTHSATELDNEISLNRSFANRELLMSNCSFLYACFAGDELLVSAFEACEA